MSSKKIDIRGDLNKAGNHCPKKTDPEVYKSFSQMLGALSMDELEANIQFCEELAGSFLLGDEERIQIMQDKMRNMTSDQLFFIKATFKQFGRLGTGSSAVVELCRSVKLPGLHVSLTDKLGFRYRTSDEDLDLLRKLYTQRLQTVKEIYEGSEINPPETSAAYDNSQGFPREMPKDFYKHKRVMIERWHFENKEHDFPSIKTMKARKFYDQSRECAKPSEPFENNGIEPA